MSVEYQFKNYLQTDAKVPAWVWTIGKVFSVSISVALVAALVYQPQLALELLWRIFIPLVPLVFFILPGVWRNICPMATLNQLPRHLGMSMAKPLPPVIKEYGYVVGIILLFSLVTMRKVYFNSDASAAALMIGGALLLAFAFGLLFKGRSGWCGSFCPLLPVQRLYGQTPYVDIRNGHCQECVGCTKNCYDFNPSAAYLADQYDQDEDYRNYRKFFAACFPGFVLAFYLIPAVPVITSYELVVKTGLFMLVSAGVFYLLDSYIKLSSFKFTAIFAVLALNIYYWFNIPAYLTNVIQINTAYVTNLSYALQTGLVILCLHWLYRTYGRESAFLINTGKSSTTQVAKSALKVLKGKADASATTITFAANGKTYAAADGDTILELAEQNKQKIESGCRAGMCGADPVTITDGWDQLSEISADEQATLDRLGFGPNTRMACCAKLKDKCSVTVSMELEPASADEVSQSAAFAIDETVNKVVIIGNGVAGITAADHIRRISKDVEVSIVGEEAHNFYNRMGIARLIYGRSAMKGLYLINEDWYEDNNIKAHLNTRTQAINPAEKTVNIGVNETLPYDRLILAMGSEARVPDFQGNELEGVFVLRKAEDALNLRSYVQTNQCQNAIIAGGGLLGLEAAYAIKEMGIQVTVLERGEWLMRRQLDRRAGEFLRIILSKMGIDIMTLAEVANCSSGADDNRQLEEIQLQDGCVLKSKLLLLAAGIKPNIELAAAAGIECDRAVTVDDQLKTSDESIYAVGDVSCHNGIIYGLWTTAADQAKMVAANCLGDKQAFTEAKPSTMLKVVGVDVLSVGEFEASQGATEYFYEDVRHRKYCKLVLRKKKAVGAILIGKIDYKDNIKKAVDNATDCSTILPQLEQGDLSAIQKLY